MGKMKFTNRSIVSLQRYSSFSNRFSLPPDVLPYRTHSLTTIFSNVKPYSSFFFIVVLIYIQERNAYLAANLTHHPN
jgi:hypothetical protein